MNLIRKSVPSAVLKIDGEAGVVEALVSVTGALDSQGDVIVPGAYSKFLGAVKVGLAEMPVVCWGHDWDRPTGVTLDIAEWRPGDGRLPADFQAKGWGALWVRYRYVLDSTDGANAYALKKAGAIKQHSVGFMVDEDSAAEGKAVEYGDGGRRYIKRIFPLVEHSDVIMGAAPQTQALLVRGRAHGGAAFFPPRRNTRAPQPVWIRAVEPAVRRMVAGEVARDRARRDVFAAIEGETASPWRRAKVGG